MRGHKGRDSGVDADARLADGIAAGGYVTHERPVPYTASARSHRQSQVVTSHAATKIGA
jgi:hypothetical protein